MPVTYHRPSTSFFPHRLLELSSGRRARRIPDRTRAARERTSVWRNSSTVPLASCALGVGNGTAWPPAGRSTVSPRTTNAIPWDPTACETCPGCANKKEERRGRDSNPRDGLTPPTRFPIALLRPTRTPLQKRRPRVYQMTCRGWGYEGPVFPRRRRATSRSAIVSSMRPWFARKNSRP